MQADRSSARIIYSDQDLKRWIDGVPSAEAARPARCPACSAPSRPVGAAVVLVGHGLRDRQVRGPLEPAGPPTEITIQVRRYRCRACRAIVVVVPRGVAHARLFSLCAIAW